MIGKTKQGKPLRVRLTQLDGKLPNIALMKLAHWHRSRGDDVVMTRQAGRDLLEPPYDVVYGSVLFTSSAPKLERFMRAWPDAIVGGTGSPGGMRAGARTVEDVIGVKRYDDVDYSIYPEFDASIGYTQRGCRFECGFCAVWRLEGKAKAESTIERLWRGPGHPRNLHLLDNDLFGQPKAEWQGRIREIREGGFKVSISQGVNVRVITKEIAAALASVEYRDTKFRERRLYTAWDSIGDERMFLRGIDMLNDAGIPGSHVMAYMVMGFAEDERWEDIHHRFDTMIERKILPYPMVFSNPAHSAEHHRELKRFQRWALTGLYRAVPFREYDTRSAAARLRLAEAQETNAKIGQAAFAL